LVGQTDSPAPNSHYWLSQCCSEMVDATSTHYISKPKKTKQKKQTKHLSSLMTIQN